MSIFYGFYEYTAEIRQAVIITNKCDYYIDTAFPSSYSFEKKIFRGKASFTGQCKKYYGPIMKSFKQFRMFSWKEKRPVLIKYAFFQIPETAIFIIALLIIDRWVNIPFWYFWSFAALWLLKDIISFPFLWFAVTNTVSENQYPRIGAEGIALDKCAPKGHVNLQGECWQAETTESGINIGKGEHVVVTGRKDSSCWSV